MSETDGIGEALGQQMRAVVMVAAQIAEQVARQAELRAQTLEREAAVAAQRLGARRAAERDTARTEVAPTREPRWWDTATLDAAARAYATADAWARQDPQLAADTTRIAEQIEFRFGAEARTAVVTAAHTGRAAEVAIEPTDMKAEKRAAAETGFAAIVSNDARAARAEAGPDGQWDTPARRAAFAASLRDVPDPEAVDARLRLDRARAHPANAATTHAPLTSIHSDMTFPQQKEPGLEH
jgi:hypothetical protein